MSSTAEAMALMRPSPYVAIDIETMLPPPDVVDQIVKDQMATWSPPGNVRKEETVAKYRETAEQKARDRAALDDRAPVSVIAMALPTTLVVFHAFPEAFEIDNAVVVQSNDEAGMLQSFAQMLNTVTDPNTEIVTHNGLSFDAPRLRFRMLVNGVTAPAALKIGAPNPHADTMKIWRHFSISNEARSGFVSLDKVSTALGLSSPKSAGITGADVPLMIEAGRYYEVAAYCGLDAATTREVYRKLVAWRGEV